MSRESGIDIVWSNICRLRSFFTRRQFFCKHHIAKSESHKWNYQNQQAISNRQKDVEQVTIAKDGVEFFWFWDFLPSTEKKTSVSKK